MSLAHRIRADAPPQQGLQLRAKRVRSKSHRMEDVQMQHPESLVPREHVVEVVREARTVERVRVDEVELPIPGTDLRLQRRLPERAVGRLDREDSRVERLALRFANVCRHRVGLVSRVAIAVKRNRATRGPAAECGASCVVRASK